MTTSNKNNNNKNSFLITKLIPCLTFVFYVTLMLIIEKTEGAGASSTKTENNNMKEETLSDTFNGYINRFRTFELTLNDKIMFCTVIYMAFELLQTITKKFIYINLLLSGKNKIQLIPVRGKHLDVLTKTDLLYIALNKLATGPFLWCFIKYGMLPIYSKSNVIWSFVIPTDALYSNYPQIDIVCYILKIGIMPIPALFIIYDFFYTILHWFLHIKGIYGLIHKHHHTQKAPTRGNMDAINVHPIEFWLGEYNHLLALYVYTNIFNFKVHGITTLAFLIIGGLLAGLNHTRYDVKIPINLTYLTIFIFPLKINFYDSKVHDVHHRIPQCNYGQYTMLWDIIFGTYRRYNPNDRINPKSQINFKTGRSYEYEEELWNKQKEKQLLIEKEELIKQLAESEAILKEIELKKKQG